MEEKNKTIVTVAGQIEKVSTMKDRGLKIVFATQELNAGDCATLMGLAQQFGAVAFAPTDTQINEKDLDIPLVESQIKSPSERLRSVLFVRWKEKFEKQVAFSYFYERAMDRIIEEEKTKID